MSPNLDLRSMSGVRPLYAFAAVAVGLLLVAWQIATLGGHGLPPRGVVSAADNQFREPNRLRLEDRRGQVLARSQRGYMLEVSPFNLWLRHTPERLLGELAAVLGTEPADLWPELVPVGADNLVHIERWPLTHAEALGLADWIQAGGPRHEDAGATGDLPGFYLERAEPSPAQLAGLLAGESGPFFQVVFDPWAALSIAAREAAWPALAERRGAAQAWAQRLCKGLFKHLGGAYARERAWVLALNAEAGPESELIYPEGVPPCWRIDADRGSALHGLEGHVAQLVAEPKSGSLELTHKATLVEWVFEGLCPSRYQVLSRFVAPESVQGLQALLTREQLSSYELWLVNTALRRYPTALEPESGLAAQQDPAHRPAVVGSYGWYQGQDQNGQAELRFGPQEGLEALAAQLIGELEFELGGAANDLQAGSGKPEELALSVRHPRAGWQRTTLEAASPAESPAVVRTTLDLDLSRRVHELLEVLTEEQQAGLAMAVVIDLGTRDVLALEWVDPYEFHAFAPLVHQFTPGSTFKLVTMAAALDGGYVRPETVFDVGQGGACTFFNNPDHTGRRRIVHEAEGFASGLQTAAQCLARSSNAGMVQIGLRVPVERWKSFTKELGYGTPTAPGLLAHWMANPKGQIGEAPNDGKEWARLRSHTSVSFGDSISTNLLQHAQALASLIGGGEFRPLNLVQELELRGQRYAPVPPEPRRLISRATSEQLRAMMRLGATIGTGKDLERPRGLDLMTKTGTTHKLFGDVCWHNFGRAWTEARKRQEADRAAGREPKPFDSVAVHKELRGQFRGSRPCYVSSIAVVGRAPDSDREVLVLLVVDDPHGKERFGSKVAGPTAVSILRAALGWEAPQQVGAPRAPAGLVLSDNQVHGLDAEPWASMPSDQDQPWWQSESNSGSKAAGPGGSASQGGSR